MKEMVKQRVIAKSAQLRDNILTKNKNPEIAVK